MSSVEQDTPAVVSRVIPRVMKNGLSYTRFSNDADAAVMASSDVRFSDLSEMTVAVGQGAFGTVWRADYLGTDVAVKECKSTAGDAAEAGWDVDKYLQRELSVLREVRHPNIVQFMGSAVNEVRAYIVTEFVPGGNVREWLIKNAALPVNRHAALSSLWKRISFGTDLARAMAYMHARNIIHRDLKLDNLLITENLRVKVCDFGFSRLLLPAEGVLEDSTLKTQKGSRGRRLTHVGTDGYMAPELMLCLDEYDASVDVFSFGIILLALVTMQLPESGMDTENAASTTNGLFERIVPGFGLNSDKMEAAVDAAIPARSILLDLIRRSVSDEPKQRPSLKDILSVLKKVELAVITELQACTLTMLQNDPSLHLPVIGASTYSLTSNAHSLASNSASAMGSLADLPAVTSVEETTTYTRSMSELSTAVASPTTPMREVASNLPSNNSLAPTQHRFSIVFKVGLHSHLTCDHCSKNIRGLLHKYLTCDDCGTLCHRKCARLLAPHCKSRTAVAASKEEITVLSISATNTETIKSASMFSH